MATTRIEAESMTLVGYSTEFSAVSSGNQVIQTASNGSASTQFAGTPGLYDLKVAYHDENDGAATLSLWVDGQKVDIWSMNAVTDSAIASTSNLRTRTVRGITLNANSVIRIAGSQAGNEFARVDYLDIIEAGIAPVPTSNTTPTANPASNGVTVNSSGVTLQPGISVGVDRIESDDMSRTGYEVEASSVASGGNVVNTSGTGIASASFSGVAGSYNLKVGYYDENDGQSAITVKVDGTTVSSWVLNEQTNSSIAIASNFRERVLSGVSLNTNSVIEIIGTKVGNEFARLDYLEIEAPTTATAPVVTPPTTVNTAGVTLPPGIAVGVGRIESDDMTRTGYDVEASSVSSGGNVVNAANTGIASAKFSGTTGSYDLKVGYYDENDGQSTLTVKVDGTTVSSWVLNEQTNSSIAATSNFRERVLSGVALNTNSVIEIIGTQEGNEFARLDYLEVAVPGTTTTPVGGVNTFQAEDAFLSGVFVESLNGGAQGGEYADYQNANNDFIEWTVTVADNSNYDLTWRYANGASNRPLAFSVNGAVVDADLAFNGTGSWNTWNTTTQTVALQAGTNKIRLRANGSSGANFDYLQVSPGGSVPPSSGGSSAKKIRVLALGDSNTRGEGTPGGYRTQFWNRAVNDGVAIDFLGTRNGGPSNLGDKDHQGQGGWSIPQMLSWVKAGNLANQNPDMILFMMGTNDANTNGAVSGVAIRDRLSTFIDEVSKVVPKAHLFVSSILPLDTPRGTAAEAKAARDFNALIPGLVSQKAAQGKRVSFVNAGGSLGVGDINGDNSATNDQNDGLHATAAGYNKLGNAWYNEVKSSNVWQQAVASQSSGANAIEADAVTNSLSGNNVIQSAAGADDLTGGGGADAFVYQNPAAGLDRILDFGNDDVLRVSASGFGGDLAAGRALGSNDYVLGSNPTAVDGGSTFLYSTSSNMLSFDADGTGGGSAIGIASFTNGFAPEASQIEIFA